MRLTTRSVLPPADPTALPTGSSLIVRRLHHRLHPEYPVAASGPAGIGE